MGSLAHCSDRAMLPEPAVPSGGSGLVALLVHQYPAAQVPEGEYVSDLRFRGLGTDFNMITILRYLIIK